MLQWLTTHEPSTEHDLSSGLRDNFNPRAQWKSAINSVQLLQRLNRPGSPASSDKSGISGGWKNENQSVVGDATSATSGDSGARGFTSDEDDEDSPSSGEKQKRKTESHLRVPVPQRSRLPTHPDADHHDADTSEPPSESQALKKQEEHVDPDAVAAEQSHLDGPPPLVGVQHPSEHEEVPPPDYSLDEEEEEALQMPGSFDFGEAGENKKKHPKGIVESMKHLGVGT